MKQNIYCISGLGADERLFKNLSIPGAELKYLQWPEYRSQDTLVSYANKFCNQVEEENPVLLGVSFGGMLAIEAAKKLNAKQVFIVSSITSVQQFPFYYRLAGDLSLYSLVPDILMKKSTLLMEHVFGAKTRQDKELLRYYLQNANPPYIRWALKAILQWKNTGIPNNLVHIHGTNDRIIPIPKAVDYRIQEGGHFMVFNMADRISKIIGERLV